MILKINHSTVYDFSSDVFLEPHYIRLYPQAKSKVEIKKYRYEIYPEPVGISRQEDEESNLIYFSWFEGMTKVLSIQTELIVKLIEFNPFDFLVYPNDQNTFPFEYSVNQNRMLSSYRVQTEISTKLKAFTKKVELESNFETIPFLLNITRSIHADFEVIYREEGAPLHPDQTYQLKTGSCRDLAWMQINILRSKGFAARFVSGYYFFEMDSNEYELHGWLEVFISGAGWIGYDPSHGIMTGSTHIALVTGSRVESTMPVSGTFRGEATSKLTTSVTIEVN